MTEIVYTKPRPREIDVTMTIRLQSVGLNARRRVFGMNRPEHLIKNSFNTNSPLELIKSSETYRHYAAIGGLAVASLDLEAGSVPVGYALAKRKNEGLIKRITGKTPVEIKEINIMPGFENQELGCYLAVEALSGFSRRVSAETSVPADDVVVKGLVRSLGFAQVQDAENSLQSYDYFGSEHTPVTLIRYKAPSVGDVISRVKM